jgi:hypothetical protein
MNDNFAQRRCNFSVWLRAFFGLWLLIAPTGCSTKSNGNSWALVGSWAGKFQSTSTYSAPITASFSADGIWNWTFQMKQSVTTTRGAWSIQGTKLVLTDKSTGEKKSHDFRIAGDVLTIENVPLAGTLTLKKQK